MPNLFKYKRMSFRLLSRIWYLIFFVLGFALGFICNNSDVVQKITEFMKGMVY